MNPYAVLNVSPGIDGLELKKAYRKMVMLYHPDRCALPNAKEKFVEVQRSFELVQKEIQQAQKAAFEHEIKLKQAARQQKYSRPVYTSAARNAAPKAAASATRESAANKKNYHFSEERFDEFKQEVSTSFGKLPLIIRIFVYLLLMGISSLLMLKYGFVVSVVFISACIVFEMFRAIFKSNAQYSFAKK